MRAHELKRLLKRAPMADARPRAGGASGRLPPIGASRADALAWSDAAEALFARLLEKRDAQPAHLTQMLVHGCRGGSIEQAELVERCAAASAGALRPDLYGYTAMLTRAQLEGRGVDVLQHIVEQMHAAGLAPDATVRRALRRDRVELSAMRTARLKRMLLDEGSERSHEEALNLFGELLTRGVADSYQLAVVLAYGADSLDEVRDPKRGGSLCRICLCQGSPWRISCRLASLGSVRVPRLLSLTATFSHRYFLSPQLYRPASPPLPLSRPTCLAQRVSPNMSRPTCLAQRVSVGSPSRSAILSRRPLPPPHRCMLCFRVPKPKALRPT